MSSPDDIAHRLDVAEEYGPLSHGNDPGGPDAREPEPDHQPWLPHTCPVIPLGLNSGKYYYLDAVGQFRELAAKDHSRLGIVDLFTRRSEKLLDYWPRQSQDKVTKEWITTGWKPDEGAIALMGACAEEGPFSAFGRIRGAGAWLGPDGDLILHLGNRILRRRLDAREATEFLECGLIDHMVYPTAPPIIPPSLEPCPSTEETGPGWELLRLISKWEFRRGDIDALLLLGWYGAARLGGALKWRPVVWVSGGAHTGKSTLQDMLRWLFGPDGLIQAADASAAGIWQKLQYASVPVAIDESESESDNRKLNAVVRLAREAASGSMIIRGGQDHQGHQFTARCCFFFSSIIMPAMPGQDRSRIAVLELAKLRDTKPPPELTERKMAELGAQLTRRLIDQWPRWQETLEIYRTGLAEVGHVARGCDVFGTLLAAADLLLLDQVPDPADVKAWCAKLKAAELAELDGEESNEIYCLQHLLHSPGDAWRQGEPAMTLGEWVDHATNHDFHRTDEDVKTARRRLKNYGITVLGDPPAPGVPNKQSLFVCKSHPALTRIFGSTMWSGMAGARGAWIQALLRLPGSEQPRKAERFGTPMRGITVPIDVVNGVSIDTPTTNQSPAGAAAPHHGAEPASGQHQAPASGAGPNAGDTDPFDLTHE